MSSRIDNASMHFAFYDARATERGQATVEAAFMIPIVMLLLLLLIQPGILLYDRMVMQAAASEGCRLLATTDAASVDAVVKPYIMRHLGAVPSQNCFHVHTPRCTWEITASGDESADAVSLTIATEVKPLPLLGLGAVVLGLTNEDGNIVMEVGASLQTQPNWALAQGGSPSDWAGAWE